MPGLRKYNLCVPCIVDNLATRAIINTAAQNTILSEYVYNKLTMYLPLGERVLLMRVGQSSAVLAEQASMYPWR